MTVEPGKQLGPFRLSDNLIDVKIKSSWPLVEEDASGSIFRAGSYRIVLIDDGHDKVHHAW